MKRSHGNESGEQKRTRSAPNPYLQTSSFSKRQHNEVFAKRNRRGDRALVFNQPEEEEAPPQPPLPIFTAPTPQQQQQPRPKRYMDAPQIEWWDAAFLPKDMQNNTHHMTTSELYSKLNTKHQKTSVYVEHPVTIPPSKQSLDSDAPLKLYQTKQELKKMRRQNRAVLTQEKRDKIAIGLIPPPPARVRISNLLRVLAADHAADPTQIESRVREEMEQRKMQHVARNLAKKLTPRERVEKLKRRIQRDALPTGGVCVAVFSVLGHGLWDMEQANELAKKRLSKVVLTARKLMLTGRFTVVSAPQTLPGVIVVEGGPKSVRKFTRLVTKRVDWKSKTLMEAEINKTKAADDDEEEKESSDDDEEEQNHGGGGGGACRLLWQGVAPQRAFEGFSMENHESALDAKQLFANKNLVHLWDLAITTAT